MSNADNNAKEKKNHFSSVTWIRGFFEVLYQASHYDV